MFIIFHKNFPSIIKATGFITLTVLDLNDNAPEFTEKNYTGSLPENCGPDVIVQMVRINDGRLPGNEKCCSGQVAIMFV